MNDLSRHLSVDEVLRRTESLYLQLRASYFARLVQSPARASYPQLRGYARYRPLPDELVHLFGFSEATVRNDAGSLDADEYLQIARQLSPCSSSASATASSTGIAGRSRSPSPSPQRASLFRHTHAPDSARTSCSQLQTSGPTSRSATANAHAGQQQQQQATGTGRLYPYVSPNSSASASPTDSALLAMRTPSPTGQQLEPEKAALELLEATLRESEQQMTRESDEAAAAAAAAAEAQRFDIGSPYSTEAGLWLEHTRDSDTDTEPPSEFSAAPREPVRVHTKPTKTSASSNSSVTGPDTHRFLLHM